eukprot:snap_masked-scaffold_3-processed-gene-21.50-mRNA-1 protein AED:0.01 eAED:0.01 QI:0/-1/0/1/-1/1/1/0/132
MVFTKFVEVGRLIQINYGKDAGKLAVVVSLINGFSVLVDGCFNGLKRQKVNLKRISLTEIVLKIQNNTRQKTLLKAWEIEEGKKQWEESEMGKRFLAQEKKKSMTDFETFKLRYAKKELNKLVQAQLKGVTA